ncbi:MAG: DUF3127 domain-containing protein [Flavobacteriaceae bacterium]
MEVVGKVRMVDQVKEVGSNGFRKRDIIVTTEEQYPQHISIQFVQDKVNLLDTFKPGDDVRVSINLRGREWVNPQGETVYFNTIQGWKIEKLVAETPTSSQEVPPIAPTQAFQPAQNINEEEHDDLPF